MEREEAIFENENNSNLESESNNRQQLASLNERNVESLEHEENERLGAHEGDHLDEAKNSSHTPCESKLSPQPVDLKGVALEQKAKEESSYHCAEEETIPPQDIVPPLSSKDEHVKLNDSKTSVLYGSVKKGKNENTTSETNIAPTLVNEEPVEVDKSNVTRIDGEINPVVCDKDPENNGEDGVKVLQQEALHTGGIKVIRNDSKHTNAIETEDSDYDLLPEDMYSKFNERKKEDLKSTSNGIGGSISTCDNLNTAFCQGEVFKNANGTEKITSKEASNQNLTSPLSSEKEQLKSAAILNDAAEVDEMDTFGSNNEGLNDQPVVKEDDGEEISGNHHSPRLVIKIPSDQKFHISDDEQDKKSRSIVGTHFKEKITDVNEGDGRVNCSGTYGQRKDKEISQESDGIDIPTDVDEQDENMEKLEEICQEEKIEETCQKETVKAADEEAVDTEKYEQNYQKKSIIYVDERGKSREKFEENHGKGNTTVDVEQRKEIVLCEESYKKCDNIDNHEQGVNTEESGEISHKENEMEVDDLSEVTTNTVKLEMPDGEKKVGDTAKAGKQNSHKKDQMNEEGDDGKVINLEETGMEIDEEFTSKEDMRETNQPGHREEKETTGESENLTNLNDRNKGSALKEFADDRPQKHQDDENVIGLTQNENDMDIDENNASLTDPNKSDPLTHKELPEAVGKKEKKGRSVEREGKGVVIINLDKDSKMSDDPKMTQDNSSEISKDTKSIILDQPSQKTVSVDLTSFPPPKALDIHEDNDGISTNQKHPLKVPDPETSPSKSVDPKTVKTLSNIIDVPLATQARVTETTETTKKKVSVSRPQEVHTPNDDIKCKEKAGGLQNDDNDVIVMHEIKKEADSDYKVQEPVVEEVKSVAVDVTKLKSEVIVVDDEQDAASSKKAEGKDAFESGLGIQIAAVSGQQHQLHANACDGSVRVRHGEPSGTFCVAWGCSNRQKTGDGRKFHRFPKDALRRKKWEAALKRDGFEATDHSRICSDHFEKENYNPSGRLKDTAVPTIFNCHDHMHLTVLPEVGAGATSAESEKANNKPQSKSKMQTCIVCQTVTRCKYNIVRNGDTKQLCGDVCFKKFRNSPNRYLQKEKAINSGASTQSLKLPVSKSTSQATKEPKTSSVTSSSVTAPAASSNASQSSPQYKTCNVCQVMNVNAPHKFCNWKGLDFCGETCLAKFQATLKNTCSHCNAYIPIDMRASFCLKIGNDMRPFCKQKCYQDFKKNLKMCAYCQKDLLSFASVSAKVGMDAKPKEFCSWSCVKKLEGECDDVQIVSVHMGKSAENGTCSVCKVQGRAVKHSVRFQSKTFNLCSDICLSAFQYTNKINVNKCDSCGMKCTSIEAQVHFIQFEGLTKRFCSDQCVNNFRMANRKVVECTWCGSKKTNFDMIERLDEENRYQLFCSLNCLSLYRVNLQAKSNLAVQCDQCKKVVPAQYHLTMSDASVRNFCSYSCVMTFQSQFSQKALPHRKPQQQMQSPAPQQASTSHSHGTRSRGRSKNLPQTAVTQASTSSVPVISDVVSLASEAAPPEKNSSPSFQANSSTAASIVQTLQKKGSLFTGDGKERIVVRAPSPTVCKNKSVQSRPFTQTKATSCRPHSQSKEVQTDNDLLKPVIVPVPVPVYIPMPSVMFTAPAPVPLPVPIPIPVPVFIPTTRKSANGIMKAIKEIVERMPSDPLEAEMLMMAEAVAADGKRPGDSDTDSEQDIGADDYGSQDATTPDTHGIKANDSSLSRKREGVGEEDMIQMALRMAEEMSGPIEDLESSVEPSVVKMEPSHQGESDVPAYDKETDPDYNPTRSGRGRGTKRQSRGRQQPVNTRPKRQKTGHQSYAEPDVDNSPTIPPQVNDPPPDHNRRLKFTFGVNAWKNWVAGKNAEIEKSRLAGSSRMRCLPTDILKCTMDELNYSLCLFIKEVRKPNGELYSPDSIYYLCLGIQQYMYENGRIDNIFTDLYFQRFTDALHELLKSLQPKVNSQGQMLCRIEEEHLWESKQLGAHSPYILLNTLIYFHTKHFILKTPSEHMSLSFAQILKHLKRGVPVKSGSGTSSKNVSLRFYCLANKKDPSLASRKNKDGVPVFEVTENFVNPLRCPVKLYEFFLSKCPESIKNRNDIFYPVPERSCVPDSPVWYSTQSIDINTMDKMLTRILLVREIQEAHLHAQAIYI